MSAAITSASDLGVQPMCEAIGLARATYYRQLDGGKDQGKTEAPERQPPARSLTQPERATVLDLVTSERFVDDAPRQIWATLLDEGKYYCSVSTIYRILRSECGVRERRDQARHPVYQKPELLAAGPNRSGRGISLSCSGRLSGPTSTST